MALAIVPITPVTGSDDPAYQISVTETNNGFQKITQDAAGLLGATASGNTSILSASDAKGQAGLANVENYAVASQAQAEAGTANDKYMTPLRTAEAIAALGGGGGGSLDGLSDVTITSPASGETLSYNGSAWVNTSASGLTYTSGADSNTTMAVNTVYVVDMSAWATADRTYTLPATAAVGDRITVIVSSGNASTFELLLTAGAGDTLNGIAGGTEWSRVFITGEIIEMTCTTANSAWMVTRDGRIAQVGIMRLSTDATGEAANTITTPTAASGAWTADSNIGSVTATATSDIKARRAGNYEVSMSAVSVTAYGVDKYITLLAYLNGDTTQLHSIQATQGASALARVNLTFKTPLAAGDFVRYRWRSEEGSKGLDSNATSYYSSFSLCEILH